MKKLIDGDEDDVVGYQPEVMMITKKERLIKVLLEIGVWL